MMKIEIFDVGHGGCAVITGTNGKRMMLDAGYRSDPNWFPCVAYAGQRIELLAFMNLDEDHLDDLPYVWERVPLGAIYTNPTVTAAALTAMKPDGMRDGVAMAHALLQHVGSGRTGPIADLGAVDAWAYYNTYGADFTDTNNLSLAMFVRYAGFTILFAGDLECAGWRALLRNPAFRADLAAVRVLIASHHGRKSGQCPEVFEIVRPDVVVFSDAARQYETQDTDGWYRHRVRGIPNTDAPFDARSGYPVRHVLTTRRDGTLTINVNPFGGYLITPERTGDPVSTWLAELLAADPAPV